MRLHVLECLHFLLEVDVLLGHGGELAVSLLKLLMLRLTLPDVPSLEMIVDLEPLVLNA